MLRCEVWARQQMVVNAPVVNAAINGVVVNAIGARKRDRHKKTEGRREYIRRKMREYRARKKAS